MVIKIPFVEYKNFADCVKKNQDKDDPDAYCAEIKRKVEKSAESDWQFDMTFEKVGDKGGHLYLAGYASNGDNDEDNQSMDMDSLRDVFDTYMKNPIVKLLHDTTPQWKGAVGKVIEKYTDSEGKEWVTSFGIKPFLVIKMSKSPKLEWLRGMIDEGLFRGLSIGGKAKSITKDGKIIVRSWLETSIVDVPSAKGSFVQVLKEACVGDNCNISKTPIPLAPDEQEIQRYAPSIEDRKRASWYNLESVFEFKEHFPHATVTDICERFGFELDYCNELLEKIETITKAAETNLFVNEGKKPNAAVQKFISAVDKMRIDKFFDVADDFLKGGPGSGVKGHKTDKKLADAHPFTDYLRGQPYAALDYIVKDLGKELKKGKKGISGLEYADLLTRFELTKVELKERKMAKSTTITGFYDVTNDFLKGGPGSGKKGHTTTKKRKLTDKERADVKNLMEITDGARTAYKDKKASTKERFAASDKFWDASEQLQKKYGVAIPALGYL